MREFDLYSGDCGSHFKPGLNRDRLCGQGPQRGCTVGVKSRAVVRRRGEGEYVCMLMFLEETGAIKPPQTVT